MSRVLAAGIIGFIVIIVIVAFAVLPGMGGRTSSTARSTTTSAGSLASSTSSVGGSSTSTAATTTTGSISITSTILTTSSSTSSLAPTSTSTATNSSTSSSTITAPQAFPFLISTYPQRVLIEPGENLTYAEIWFNVLPSAQNLPQGTAHVNVSLTTPSGISITLPPNPLGVVISSQQIQNYIYYTMATNASVTPGQYHVSGVATYGSLTDTFGFTVTVVQYLVTINNDYFSPHALTVPVGATVWWINTDPTMGGQEVHDIHGAGSFRSPTLEANPSYDSWSYTFTSAGTYNYTDDYTQKLTASVVVTG